MFRDCGSWLCRDSLDVPVQVPLPRCSATAEVGSAVTPLEFVQLPGGDSSLQRSEVHWEVLWEDTPPVEETFSVKTHLELVQSK